MSDEAEHEVLEDRRSDEEKVLEAIAGYGLEGCTARRVHKDLGIPQTRVATVIAGLEHAGRVKLRKEGIEWYWFAVEGPDAKSIAEQDPGMDDGRIACPVEGCKTRIKNERQNLGSHLNVVHGNLSPRDRVEMLDRLFLPEDRPSIEDLKAEFDKLNEPVEVVPPEEPKVKPEETHTSKTKKGQKGRGGRPPKDPNVPRVPCPIEGCGLMLALTRDNINHHLARQHGLSRMQTLAYLEKMFPKAPVDRVPDAADEPPARPLCSTCADDQCGDRGKDLIACDDHEPVCEGDGCTIAVPADMGKLEANIQKSDQEGQEKPSDKASQSHLDMPSASIQKDALAEFAEFHRKRLRKDIRTMKRAEKRLWRRAIAVGRMVSRIHEARLVKERELRRFERELEEVSLRDHPCP